MSDRWQEETVGDLAVAILKMTTGDVKSAKTYIKDALDRLEGRCANCGRNWEKG